MKNKKLLIAFSLILLSACTPTPTTADEANAPVNEDTAMEKTEDSTEKDETMMEDDAMEGDHAEVDYTIDMSSFKFEPNIIKASPGETITVKVISQEGLHDLIIEELDVASSQLKSGKGESSEETFEITVPEDLESGTEYEFYCSVGDHRAQGMVGTFMVK